MVFGGSFWSVSALSKGLFIIIKIKGWNEWEQLMSLKFIREYIRGLIHQIAVFRFLIDDHH